jgi:hypothetical protein
LNNTSIPEKIKARAQWVARKCIGSHKELVGSQNNDASHGGAVIGYRKEISGAHASVTGRTESTDSGYDSFIGEDVLREPNGGNKAKDPGFSVSARQKCQYW